MNNKGSSIILMIFEVLVVVIVMGMTLSIAVKLGTSEGVTKTDILNDIYLMVNAMVTMNADLVVEYPFHDLSKYDFIITDNEVNLISEGNLPLKKRISLPEGYKAEGLAEKQPVICLEKKDKKILLRSCKREEQNLYRVEDALGGLGR